jgi:hypothetical protein
VIGENVHGYRVERALSEDKGGFGEVFVARHATSGAEALRPELSTSHDIITRFFNEANPLRLSPLSPMPATSAVPCLK